MCVNISALKMYITSVTQRWQKTLKSVAYSKECLPSYFTLFVCLLVTTRTLRRDRLEQLRNDTLVREATLLWRTRLRYICGVLTKVAFHAHCV